MRPLSCGCEEITKANKIKDADVAQSQREVGQEQATQWHCPRVCGSLPKAPPPAALESLAEIEATTKASGLLTCPNWYASLPWAHLAARARRWREFGELESIASPTSALVAAIEEIDASKAARDADDDEKREQRRKANGG